MAVDREEFRRLLCKELIAIEQVIHDANDPVTSNPLVGNMPLLTERLFKHGDANKADHDDDVFVAAYIDVHQGIENAEKIARAQADLDENIAKEAERVK